MSSDQPQDGHESVGTFAVRTAGRLSAIETTQEALCAKVDMILVCVKGDNGVGLGGRVDRLEQLVRLGKWVLAVMTPVFVGVVVFWLTGK